MVSPQRVETRGLDILVVEDEPDIASSIAGALTEEGHRVDVELNGADGLRRLRHSPYDLVISDVRMPRVDGFELFDWIRMNLSSTAVVLMSAYGSIPEAVSALRRNALTYLRKPFELDELIRVVDEAALSVPNRVDEQDGLDSILVGRSPVMSSLKERLLTVAESDASVLIHGETGTGKELVARSIHRHSARRDRPFVAINCGALPESLIEAELFGHSKGAFTGAHERRIGSFVAARGGTLLLDEITEMPHSCQVKLLRVLQEGVVQPLGTTELVEIDVRVLAATNVDLRSVRTGALREDLFYRLRVLDLRLPPLRERASDIPDLVGHFLEKHRDDRGKLPTVSPHSWALLRRYPFPGNVRELSHAVQHALVLSRGERIEPRHLPDEIQGLVRQFDDAPSLRDSLAELEEEIIVRTLEEVGWVKSRAAERLGISRKNLWEKMKRYGIEPVTPPETDA